MVVIIKGFYCIASAFKKKQQTFIPMEVRTSVQCHAREGDLEQAYMAWTNNI